MENNGKRTLPIIPLRTLMKLLHSNIWWSDGMTLIKNGFTYGQGLEFYYKDIQYVDDVWDSVQRNFLT